MNRTERIDFVIRWVDGSDPDWRARKHTWSRKVASAAPAPGAGSSRVQDPGANGDCRYRDFGLLKYWFRAVERCAPWVGRVFFVTNGQRPDWLDESHPKLRLVDHRDFIPAEWLPTFNSRPIDLNLHRIPDLSERFVFFDDDMFLLHPVSPDFWFRRGLPRLSASLGFWRKIGFNNNGRTLANDYLLLHRTLDVTSLLWRNIGKWVSPLHLGPARAAANLLRLVANGMLPVASIGHLPAPMLKSTLAEIWETCPRELAVTSSHRFRADDQVNRCLVSTWDLAKGRFSPVGTGRRRGLCVGVDDIPAIKAAVANRAVPQICINDHVGVENPARVAAELMRIFNAAFPDQSSFEKGTPARTSHRPLAMPGDHRERPSRPEQKRSSPPTVRRTAPDETGRIDFVVPWVDGSDPVWRAKMLEWRRQAVSAGEPPDESLDPGANGDCRYRDFGTLRYWFRAVARCAPWVGRVFLITDGQKPGWLDESHPKLRIVDHRDFIPEEWLPTFNANPIEMNIHRIPDLSERFVFFNDDMFLLRPVTPDFWFRRGLPRLPASLGYWRGIGNNQFGHIVMNDYMLLHQTLDVTALLWRNAWKWVSPFHIGPVRAAANLLRLVANGTLPMSSIGHRPAPMLKSTLAEIWETCPRELAETSACRFRADEQVNRFLVSGWDLAKGRFSPVGTGRRRGLCLGVEDIPAIKAAVADRSVPQICINDHVGVEDPDRIAAELTRIFEATFPEPSSFEKNGPTTTAPTKAP